MLWVMIVFLTKRDETIIYCNIDLDIVLLIWIGVKSIKTCM